MGRSRSGRRCRQSGCARSIRRSRSQLPRSLLSAAEDLERGLLHVAIGQHLLNRTQGRCDRWGRPSPPQCSEPLIGRPSWRTHRGKADAVQQKARAACRRRAQICVSHFAITDPREIRKNDRQHWNAKDEPMELRTRSATQTRFVILRDPPSVEDEYDRPLARAA
jgi:hypothetical protein